MIIFSAREPHRIAKARPKWKTTRTKSRTEALTRAMAGSVRLDFFRGIQKFKSKINPERVYDAWMSKDYTKLYSLIPWHTLPEDLEPFAKGIHGTLKKSTDFNISKLPPPVSRSLRLDMRNPRLREYVKTRTGELIRNINADTQALVSRAISRSFDQALTPRRVANLIKPSIGLFPRQATALENYRNGLEKQGLTPARVDELSTKYEERLLDYRSLMIGRTETRDAFNEGQLAVWDEAAEQGLIDKSSAMKQWVTDGNPCPICIDLEEQGPIPLDETWDTDDGPIDGPTAHPNCYCSLEMVFQETTGDEP